MRYRYLFLSSIVTFIHRFINSKLRLQTAISRKLEASQRSIALIGSRTSELTVIANNDILVLKTGETVSHVNNETPETSFSSTEDNNMTLPATSPIYIASFLTTKIFRADMTSLSADLLVIGGWEFDLDNETSWPRFKQIDLVGKIGTRRLGDPEETSICFISNKVDFDDMDDIIWVRPSSCPLRFFLRWSMTRLKHPNQML